MRVNTVTYRLKLKKGDFEVEVQGDKEWVESRFEKLTTEKISIAGIEGVMPRGMPETLGEFLDQKGNPEKHTEVVVAYAYWLFHVEKMESFNVKDIVSCYDRTRKTKPSNPNQMVNQNVARHLFAEAKEKKDGFKAWVITRTGEEYVEQMS